MTAKEQQAIHDLTVIAEACEEQWEDWTNGFDTADVLAFIRTTGQKAREAIAKIERE